MARLPSFLLVVLAFCSSAYACSDFLLNTTTSNVISARTMDFKVDLHTVVEVIPRNTLFQELPVFACPDCEDYAWKSKYGSVVLNIWGLNVATDGLNEKGLSAAWLYLVGTKYPRVDEESQESNPNATLKPIVTSVCSYLLGNFASVKEVREGLQHFQIAEFDERIQIPLLHQDTGLGRIPLHISVHDAYGESLVIEFLHHKTKIYDNVNDVLTNDPPLKQQLQELQANGFDSIPGGYGSTERFLRLSVLNHLAANGYQNAPDHASYLDGTSEQAAVSHALHILNTVVRPPITSATEWSVIRDHQRKKLYFQSTYNQLLRVVDLSKLDLSQPSSRHLVPVTFGDWAVDVTPAFQNPANTAKTMDLPPRTEIEALLQHLLDQANGTTNLNAAAVKAHHSIGHLLMVLAGGLVLGIMASILIGTNRIRQMRNKHRHSFTYQRIKDAEETKYHV